MTKQVQRRRGTATQHTSFTGAEGELSVNTTNKSVHVHDNVTAGGFEAARADMDNVTSSSILTAAGITATTAELNYVDGVTSAIQTQLDGKAGTASPTFTGTLTTANLTATGTTTLAGASTSADITFGDNDKAIFGAGSDLQIYHDGSNSYIDDAGAGDLLIRASNLKLRDYQGNDYISMNDDGAGGTVRIKHLGNTKLATTSTGIDVTGTVTADGLTVADGTSGQINIHSTGYNIQGGTNYGDMRFNAPRFRFFEDGTTLRMNIDNGDISFYEDTGTTAKFFWDASAESLGIGTSSPSNNLEVRSSSAVSVQAAMTGSSSITLRAQASGLATIEKGGTANALTIVTDSTERMRIDSSGNVGIGVVPENSSGTWRNFEQGGMNLVGRSAGGVDGMIGTNYVFKTDNSEVYKTTAATSRIFFDASEFKFQHAGSGTAGTAITWSEAMRIDSSGNLLVGTTDTDVSNNSGSGRGININSGGGIKNANTGTCITSNLLGVADGTIIDLRKNGTTVGSIGSYSSGLDIAGSSRGIRFSGSTIFPVTNAGGVSDNNVDLGYSGGRFDDIFATNGTIQTSDANEKQDIAELSDAEQRVAVAAKGLLRKFRWKDAVAEKGDEARTHFGIIAQDLQAAFAAEGLDAGDYAMFISSTWTDEETGEERTRMGVRYSELLAFIIAAI